MVKTLEGKRDEAQMGVDLKLYILLLNSFQKPFGFANISSLFTSSY